MYKKYWLLSVLAATLLFYSCSRKHAPETGAGTGAAASKPAVKKIKHPPVAKVISVNDAAAKKSFDGRLYYDVDGHRYWRNYNDGKYYLFNKNMFSDPAFTPH